MAKKNKELQPKEASLTVLQRIAKALLNSDHKAALQLGQQLQGLKEGVEELPKEVFDALGAKFEKNARALMTNNESDVLARLEKVAAQLEQQATPQGLSGMHNTQQLQSVTAELSQLKGQTEHLQTMQQDVQRTVSDVKAASETVQQVLTQAKTQVEDVQASAKQAVANSEHVLATMKDAQTKMAQQFEKTASLTTTITQTVQQQIDANLAATKEQQLGHQALLHQFEENMMASLTDMTKLSKNNFDKLDENVANVEDELEDLKKVLKMPIEAVLGQVNVLKGDVHEIQKVTAFLEQKAKQSMQLVNAEEDEAYVTEAVELVRVLVDRLYVGAQLYAKHRDTIEAIEQQTVEQAAWEIEKEQYEAAAHKVVVLEQQIEQQQAEITKLQADVLQQQRMFENKESSFPVDVIRFMATDYAIEQWPPQLAKKVEEAGIQVHKEFIKGTIVDVTKDNASKVQRYVELPNGIYGKVQLSTSSYYVPETQKVIQKATSEVVQQQTTKG